MHLHLRNVLFVLVVPGTVGVYVPWLIARERAFVTGWPFVVGWMLFALGFGGLVWSVWAFGSYGRGTPLPQLETSTLVIRGLYRYSRNPMYVGVLTMIVAWAVLFGDWRLMVYFTAVGVMFHAFAILYEEPRLERRFGADYLRYKENVGRWLPRVRKRG